MPDEAWELGLFDPALSEGELDRYLSKSALKHLQEPLNPASWAITVEDKALFYRLCRALGIATPDLYAIVYRRMPGWTQQGITPHGPSSWAAFLRETLPEHFVLKPSWGVYGREVRLLVRRGDQFVDHHGRSWEAGELVDKMFADPLDRGWILQERLVAHDMLRRVSESPALQTFRIITLIGTSAQRMLHAHLKIIVGDNAVDNYDRGRRGNLQARVDVERGVLGPAALLREGGRGFTYLDMHPVTGHQIEGLTVPSWEKMCTFTLELARQFLPLQTIGWDVALTPDGPRVVEGNAWYDPPPPGQGAELPEFARQLQTEGSRTHE